MSKVITTIRNAWRIKDLRSKILFTLFILVIYRLGAQIPVPFIDTDMLDTLNASANTGLLQYLNIFSGEAFSRATLFALSISPYITSSIVMQLLCVAIPALERMSKEEDGKKKINKITRFVTAALSLVTAIGYYFYLQQNGLVNYIGSSSGMKFFTAVVVIACYCAGAALIMWLGEKITENGIGNGISMILFANIVASFPNTLVRIFKLIFNTNKNLPDLVNSGYTVTHPNLWWIGTIIGVLGLVMCVALIAFMVFMTNSERRLPVQYAKRVVGRKMYGGQNTTLPLKLNMTGVMPIIFASTLCSLPGLIFRFINLDASSHPALYAFFSVFNYNSALYLIVYVLLIVAFNYFYVAIQYNPVDIANQLRKNNGTIPGIRPGKPTSDFITKTLSKITLIGAVFLAIVAGFPIILGNITGTSIQLGGTTLLIVVGVALETGRSLEGYMTARYHKGFLE